MNLPECRKFSSNYFLLHFSLLAAFLSILSRCTTIWENTCSMSVCIVKASETVHRKNVQEETYKKPPAGAALRFSIYRFRDWHCSFFFLRKRYSLCGDKLKEGNKKIWHIPGIFHENLLIFMSAPSSLILGGTGWVAFLRFWHGSKKYHTLLPPDIIVSQFNHVYLVLCTLIIPYLTLRTTGTYRRRPVALVYFSASTTISAQRRLLDTLFENAIALTRWHIPRRQRAQLHVQRSRFVLEVHIIHNNAPLFRLIVAL